MHARDVVRRGDTAIAVFTDRIHLAIKTDGTGTTGWWMIHPERDIDRVIMYHRAPGMQRNDMDLAAYNGAERRTSDGRPTIRFRGVHRVGTTEYTWAECVDGGQNPVR